MNEDRVVATALEEIAVLLELSGDDGRARQFRDASHASDHAHTPPYIAEIVTELELTGGAIYLDELRENTPEGLFEMLRLPGLGPARIWRIRSGLGIETIPELEVAARDGRLAALPRFGARIADGILRSLTAYRAAGAPLLLPHAQAKAARLADAVAARPGVRRAEVAGEVRRHLELVRELVIVASCDGDPVAAAAALAHAPEVEDARGVGTNRLVLRFDDGVRAQVHCVRPAEYGITLLRATGSSEHVASLERRAVSLGMTFAASTLVDSNGAPIAAPEESDVYRVLGLSFVPPELREQGDEVAAAGRHDLPGLVGLGDLRGRAALSLECTATADATIAEMAAAARSADGPTSASPTIRNQRSTRAE